MRDRIYRAEAVILRRMDVGEADRMLTIMTPQGKRRVVAKGIRKTTSRLAGSLELFVHTGLLLAVGRSRDIVTQSAPRHTYDRLRTDLERIGAAYYVAELLDRFTGEEEENRPAFDLLVETLGALDASAQLDLVLRWYELRLLGISGYRPNLHYCANCQEPLTEQADRFSATVGGVLCPRCAKEDPRAARMDLATFKLLRYLQAQPLSALEKLNVSQPVRKAAEDLLRNYIRQLLERDLKSVAFLADVRGES